MLLWGLYQNVKPGSTGACIAGTLKTNLYVCNVQAASASLHCCMAPLMMLYLYEDADSLDSATWYHVIFLFHARFNLFRAHLLVLNTTRSVQGGCLRSFLWTKQWLQQLKWNAVKTILGRILEKNIENHHIDARHRCTRKKPVAWDIQSKRSMGTKLPHCPWLAVLITLWPHWTVPANANLTWKGRCCWNASPIKNYPDTVNSDCSKI